MKIRQNIAIAFSGILWMGVGILLLIKGFTLLLTPTQGAQGSALFTYAKSLAGNGQQGALFLICLGLLIGFFKGRFVLSKTANRVIGRIRSLPNPCSIFSLYSKPYLLILSSMMFMGVFFKWIPLPFDIKGVVDVAIGSALTNGASFYFRHLVAQKKEV